MYPPSLSSHYGILSAGRSCSQSTASVSGRDSGPQPRPRRPPSRLLPRRHAPCVRSDRGAATTATRALRVGARRCPRGWSSCGSGRPSRTERPTGRWPAQLSSLSLSLPSNRMVAAAVVMSLGDRGEASCRRRHPRRHGDHAEARRPRLTLPPLLSATHDRKGRGQNVGWPVALLRRAADVCVGWARTPARGQGVRAHAPARAQQARARTRTQTSARAVYARNSSRTRSQRAPPRRAAGH